MNREIKFRAFSNVTKTMYWFDIMNGNRHNTGAGYISMTPFGEPITKPNGLYKDNMIPVDPNDCEIMQFTGLHDKNGVEIWEGDVIECHSAPTNIVHWYWDSWCYENYHAQSLPLGELGNPYNNNGNLDCEIIGNIYENPELK